MSQLLIEKYIKVSVQKALKEQEEQIKKSEKSMYLIYRFPGLKKTIEDLMSPAFGRYISNVHIVSPKPTTFKIELINNQDFTIIYQGKNKFTAKISGKKYFTNSLGDLEKASDGITELLQLNYAPEEGKSFDPLAGGQVNGPGSSSSDPGLGALDGLDTSFPDSGATPSSTGNPENPEAFNTPAPAIPGNEGEPVEPEPNL